MVTVIVPAYNAEKYIERCICSILSQTYKELEVIVVDDGSSDRTGEICDNFKIIDDRFEVIHKKNEGSERAREMGVKMSKGTYLMFCDADDYLNHDVIEIALDKLIKNHVDIVGFNYLFRGKQNLGIVQEEILDNKDALKYMFLMKKFDGNMNYKLFRADVVKNTNVNFYQKRNCDFLTMAEILKLSERILVIPYVGYYYTYVLGSQSHNIVCNVREEEFEKEAYRLFVRIKEDFPEIMCAAEYFWLEALLYVCIKMEKDSCMKRKSVRFLNIKMKLKNAKKFYMTNCYMNSKDRAQFLLCYFGLFRGVYKLYQYVRGGFINE